MLMPMVNIRIVRVTVTQRCVGMGMSMCSVWGRLKSTGHGICGVAVQVVFVVPMGVVVLQ